MVIYFTLVYYFFKLINVSIKQCSSLSHLLQQFPMPWWCWFFQWGLSSINVTRFVPPKSRVVSFFEKWKMRRIPAFVTLANGKPRYTPRFLIRLVTRYIFSWFFKLVSYRGVFCGSPSVGRRKKRVSYCVFCKSRFLFRGVLGFSGFRVLMKQFVGRHHMERFENTFVVGVVRIPRVRSCRRRKTRHRTFHHFGRDFCVSFNLLFCHFFEECVRKLDTRVIRFTRTLREYRCRAIVHLLIITQY